MDARGCRVAAIADELRRGTELLRATDPGRAGPPFELRCRVRSILAVADECRTGSTVPPFRCSAAASRRKRRGWSPSQPFRCSGRWVTNRCCVQRGQARHSLHPLVQQAAAARLDVAEGGARAAARKAHARFFQRLADAAAARGRKRRCAKRCNADRGASSRTAAIAWRWMLEQDAIEALIQIAPTVYHYL